MMRRLLFEQWSDFYSGQPTQTYGSRTSQLKITSSGNVYVSNALFNKITTSGGGGAIYCSSVTILFLSESCSFINITASGQGGAIYLYGIEESILYKVCGYGCSTSGVNCHFDYIGVTNDATKRNFLSFVSVCHLIHTGISFNIDSLRGNIKYNSLNSSQNECDYYPGLSCEPQSGDNCCIIEYCSVTNCTSKSSCSIRLFTSYSKKSSFLQHFI
jgi:predicted outer membrane repeat protein